MKILVAEDTRSNLLYLKKCIEAEGHNVFLAETGIEALESYENVHPDLVLLDVNMPEMNGIEVAKKIRDRQRDDNLWVPIIFISAMDKDKDVVRGLEVGGDDYITKPVSHIVLNAKLRAMKRIYDMQIQLEKANRQLRQYADQDSLTGLANRRKFDDFLRREWSRTIRMKTSLSLCICDVDFFKQYNDLYGHQKGDQALVSVAKNLTDHIRRPGDLVARMGGEEFAIILPETNLQGAKLLLERVREALLSLAISHAGSSVSDVLSMSIGIATIELSKSSQSYVDSSQLIKKADEALYIAKGQGRNQVVGCSA